MAALQKKRKSGQKTMLGAGIKWTRDGEREIWNGEFESNKTLAPITCRIEKKGNGYYFWSMTLPDTSVAEATGNTEGDAWWNAADDVRAAINAL